MGNIMGVVCVFLFRVYIWMHLLLLHADSMDGRPMLYACSRRGAYVPLLSRGMLALRINESIMIVAIKKKL